MSSLAAYQDIAGRIDHALLAPTLTQRQLDDGCLMARAYQVAGVCIMPYYLRRCVQWLAGSGVQPCTVIGFPLGVNTTDAKVAEARQALAEGATELDMVCNISAALTGDWMTVHKDIAAVIAVAHDLGRKVKVIFENCYLKDEHKIRLCEICAALHADWVKTSTGFASGGFASGGGGATDDDLKLMLQHSPAPMQVKAAGGIRTLERAKQIRDLGCTRIGASATQSICDQLRNELGLDAIPFAPASPSTGSY
ncbi:MAG: deoxyribose-phosphate aldolase [Phycisphaeraceae bacterium]